MDISFIRHYKLAFPFDQRKNISEKEFIALSKGEVEPSINPDIEDYLNTKIADTYKDTELIIASPSNRTIESAQAIKKFFRIKTVIQVSELLKECVWNPELEGSRIQRFIDGSELSSLKDTWNRIEKLEEFLKTKNNEKILCVTHSFFMQILYLYFFNKPVNLEEIKYEDIKNSFHGDYLKGFTITL